MVLGKHGKSLKRKIYDSGLRVGRNRSLTYFLLLTASELFRQSSIVIIGGNFICTLGHKDAAYVRSHFDGIEVRVPDAPRANEFW